MLFELEQFKLKWQVLGEIECLIPRMILLRGKENLIDV